MPLPHEEQLTTAAAIVFIFSVGMVSLRPSAGSLWVRILLFSALSFVSLYMTSEIRDDVAG